MIQTQEIQKNQKKGFIAIIISAALVVAVFIALEQSNDAQLYETLSQMDRVYLTLSFISMSLAFLGMGLRWRALMPCSPPVLPLSGIVCAGLLLNYATPGPLGELAAAYFASKRYPLSLSQALASGIIARVVGLISAALIGACIWFLFPISVSPELLIPIQMISLFCLGIGAGLFLLLFFSSFWTSLTRRISQSMKHNTGWKQKIQKALEAVLRLCQDASTLSTTPDSSYMGAIFWSLFSHCSVILGIVFLIMSMQAKVYLIGIIFTYAVTTAGAVLLFALPGSYIGWDALFLGLLLSTAQLTQTESFAIVGIVRLQQLSYMLLGGISLNWLMKPNPKPQK